MTTRTAALLTAIALSGVVQTGEARAANTFQEKKGEQKTAPSVAGRWTMSVKGGPHGDMTMSLELTQDGKKVGGTFATPHGDLPLEGELVDATLTIATSGGDTQVSLTAKLKENGTLEGYLSSQMGDMTWTASRSTGK
jgi:uncharacterized beta-barrel protein YwiB (DUF1934 family)